MTVHVDNRIVSPENGFLLRRGILHLVHIHDIHLIAFFY